MSKIVNYFSLLCIGLMLATCRQADDWSMSGKTGFLVSLADEESVAGSRATPQELGEPAVTAFNLKIVRSATGEEVYNGGYTSDVIAASAGLYELTASFGDNPVLALDDPYYEGKVEGVEVKDGETASVTIPCRVANALLSVKFENTDKIAEIYSDYHITVEVAGEKVEMEDISKSAYFRAGSSVKIYFVGTLKNGGEEKSVELVDEAIPASLVAGEHLILTLKVSPELLVNISEVEIKDVTVTETIPVSWLPKPKTEAEGFDESNTLAFAETEVKTARLNLNLSSPLQDIKFKFDFQDEQFDGALETGKEYLLSEPADRATVEAALGITLPEPGTEEASLDLSALVAKLHTNAGVPTTNRITVVPKANDRWSSEKMDADSVYTLVCNRPEFSVAVNPNNVWSKEFTMDEVTVTAGSAETIGNNLTYQYRVSGTDKWIDSETRLVQFAEYPANKNYEVRGVFRDVIASEPVSVVLETPEQLPNSDMEEWSTAEGEEFRVSDSWLQKKTYYRFYPYAEGENDIWWDTNNMRSQDGSIVLGMGHPTCFAPCVSYSEGIKHGDNRSALIYTSGHGGGYTSTGEVLYEEGAFAGSLFVGSYNWSDGTETIRQGHSFSVRPSAFVFYYRYIPKNTDTFKAYIELKNGEEVIATGTFIPNGMSEDSGWQSAVVPIDYVESPKRATSIFVQFLSTTKTSFSEDDFDKDKSITFPVMGDWSVHIGSMLYIDDISLVYDK